MVKFKVGDKVRLLDRIEDLGERDIKEKPFYIITKISTDGFVMELDGIRCCLKADKRFALITEIFCEIW
jgi:hypothetical protein